MALVLHVSHVQLQLMDAAVRQSSKAAGASVRGDALEDRNRHGAGCVWPTRPFGAAACACIDDAACAGSHHLICFVSFTQLLSLAMAQPCNMLTARVPV